MGIERFILGRGSSDSSVPFFCGFLHIFPSAACLHRAAGKVCTCKLLQRLLFALSEAYGAASLLRDLQEMRVRGLSPARLCSRIEVADEATIGIRQFTLLRNSSGRSCGTTVASWD